MWPYVRPSPSYVGHVSDLRNRLEAALGSGYACERELPGGAASRLFLAMETALSRRVVIKVLAAEAASAVGAARFQQEMELTAQLQHPHILAVLTAGARDDLLYYVMPYVAGESLRHRLEREGALPVADGILLLREVADALAFAHQHGIVHRDVKPENILIQGGHAVIMDFGVARALLAARGGRRLTDPGTTGGITLVAAMYSRGTGTNNQRIELMWSRSGAISYTASSGTRLGITHPLLTFLNSTAQSTSQYVVSNASVSSYWNNTIGGGRNWLLPVSSTVSPGDYYVAWGLSLTSNYSGLAIRSVVPMMQSAQSIMMGTSLGGGGLAHWGQASSATNAGHNWPEGVGTYTVAGVTIPTNITLSNGIRAGTASVFAPYFELVGYQTNLAVGG